MRKIFLSATAVFITAAGFAQGATGAIAPSIATNSNSLVSRAPDTRGWSDPALNHNRLLANRQGDGAQTVVGQYKVTGSSFLFGQNHDGDIIAPTEKAYNITISYNTFNQELEFISSSNPGRPLIKEPGDVDSFTIRKDIENGLMEDLHFVYGKLLNTSEKAYFQVVAPGSRFSLYKRYKSELGIDPSNYGQSDLRRFELSVEYFYYDSETKKLKKLKPNPTSITKEFKSTRDLSSEIDLATFDVNPEAAMRKVFASLNLKAF